MELAFQDRTAGSGWSEAVSEPQGVHRLPLGWGRHWQRHQTWTHGEMRAVQREWALSHDVRRVQSGERKQTRCVEADG